MKLDEVKQVIRELVTTKTHIVPMLWGRHGIGKSSIVQQLGKELGYDVVTVILSQKDPVDLTGMLYVKEVNGMSVTGAHPADWFARAMKKGKTILFLDEFNMAPKEVMKAAFELVLDRRLNNIVLPEDVFIVCAGNPDDDRYDVTELSESLRDRMMHLHVKPDVEGWLDYAKKTGINQDVIGFISINKEAIRAHDAKDAKFPVEINHSERSWERAAKVHELNLPGFLRQECIRGIVGLEHSVAFMKLCGGAEMPISVEDILSGGYKAELKKQIKSGRVDLLMRTVDDLAAYVEKIKDMPKPLLKFIDELPMDCTYRAIAQVYAIGDISKILIKNPSIKAKLEKISKVTK